MGTEALVLRLDQIGRQDIQRVGGKAVHLGELTRAGLPVPDGFCLTTEAFDRFLEIIDAAHLVDDLGRCGPADTDERGRLAALLRARIEAGPLPAEIETAVVKQWQRALDGAPCAVRSSATAEDLIGASSAGQYETVLNVRERGSLLAAVRRCWASVFSDHALAYRARSGLGDQRVAMAVFVQRMVAPDAAGILFTINPLAARADEMLIEASYGLGEVVVSGRVTPDRLIVAREPLRVRERTVSSKTLELTVDELGGVREQAVAPERAELAALPDETAERLARLALVAERQLGGPQDVEWALAGGQLFVLQSRPITRSAVAPAMDDRQVWTNMNVGEILPDVVSPLTWSIIQRTVGPLFARLLAAFGLDLEQTPLLGLVSGRVYFNLNTVIAAVRALPFGHRMDVTSGLGGLHADLEESGALAAIEQNLPTIAWSWTVILRRLPLAVGWWALSHSASERRLRLFSERLSERRRQNLGALSDAALIAELDLCTGDLWNDLAPIASDALTGTTYVNALEIVCGRWFPGEPVTNQLLTGMGGMSSAEAGLDLWRLAVAAREHSDVAHMLQAGADFDATRVRLAATDSGRAFLARWDTFMSRHGHHARGEIEVMNPRWSDEPDFVLDLVRSYLSNSDGKDPLAVHAAQTRARVERSAALRARLRTPITRMVFDSLVRRAQRGVLYRENAKNEFVRLSAHERHVALELGRRLAARGTLERADDVFFLSFDELRGAASDGRSADLRASVAVRRQELERNRSIRPPAVVVGRFDPDRDDPQSLDDGTDRLTGLGVSPGVVSGPARVILRSDATERVLDGEILVAPFTDPGWTPYFQLAAGLVTDLGGMLSHGSIIAREYGLPAVVNVARATHVIRNGDQLQVDGTRGEVRILRPETT
jgi:pyruvate,water dikinase